MSIRIHAQVFLRILADIIDAHLKVAVRSGGPSGASYSSYVLSLEYLLAYGYVDAGAVSVTCHISAAVINVYTESISAIPSCSYDCTAV